MKFSFSLFLSFVVFGPSFAQRNCGTEEYIRQYYHLEMQKPGNNLIPYRDTVVNEIITIPVVVHLLFNNSEQNITDDQILSQIEVLNKDFRMMNVDRINTPAAFRPFSGDSRIMFCLAKVAPDGRSTKGIVRRYTNNPFFQSDDGMKFKSSGGDDAWDHNKYLNIWVCSLFGRNLGYATPPGGQPGKDGVVINYNVFGAKGFLVSPYDKGRTTTHEIGHWMGLKHLWGDASCGTDDIDDTPRQQDYNFGCPSFPHTTGCSETINGDMFMNFMDFTDDACMNMFTNGQKRKMRGNFALGNARNPILVSTACDGSLASGGALPDDSLPEVKKVPSVKIFPNPVKAEINILSVNDYSLEGKMISIFSIQGNMIQQHIPSGKNDKMDLSNLPAGIYIIKIGTGNDRRVAKFVKL